MTPAAFGTGAMAAPLSVAADALQSAIALDGAPFEAPPELFGVDVVDSVTLVLDQRTSWTDGWRTALWNYHDALALVVLNVVNVDSAVAELEAVVSRLVREISNTPRAAAALDFRVPAVLARVGVRGCNLIRTDTGYVAAAQRLGPTALADLSVTQIEQLSSSGLLLWAASEEALLERIDSYVRALVLIALLGEWIALIEHVHVRPDAERESRRATIITPLLARAAGASTLSDAALEGFVINELRASIDADHTRR